jgi:acetyl esterase/lipase
MFFHGGVWIAGNFENHKRLVRDLVVGSEAVAVFPDYTFIREAHYPTQITQAYSATKWVVEHGDDLKIDSSRLAVVGNSVGGNMAAVIALMAKNRSGPSIRFQALLFPALDPAASSASYQTYAVGRFLPRTFMQYGWKLYAPDPQTHKDPYVSPLEATPEELKGLGPVYIQTVENDILRDEGEAYARKLDAAGIDVTSVRYNGMIHDFVILNALRNVPGTRSALRQATEEIKQHLR